MKGTARKALPFAVVLAVLAAAPPASAAAGWKYQSTPNPGGFINFLEAVSTVSSTDAWADGVYLDRPGASCRTLIEHYDGTKWSHVGSPNPGSANDYLFGIKMTSSSNAWAVGTYGTSSVSKSLVLHYDGSSWTQQSSPSPDARLNTLISVAATSSTSAWAVGARGEGTGYADCSQYDRPGVLPASPSVPAAGLINTLIEHYDGTGWKTQSGVNPGSCENILYGASTTSSTDAWAAGFSNGGCMTTADKTLVEHYNGTGWAKLNSPNPGVHGNVLNDISADDTTDVWAVGDELDAQGYAANGLILHDNGTTWKTYKVVKGTASALYGIKATSTTNVWAVGVYVSNGREIPLILHFNGTKWSAQNVKIVGASALYGVGATGTANAFSVGAYAVGSINKTLAYRYS